MPYLLGVLVVFQILDAVFTRIFVGRGPIGELNPLLTTMAQQSSFLVLKIVGALACAVLLWLLAKRFRSLAMITTAIIAVGYVAIFCWNVQTVIR